jgi:hypothetical protein
VRPVLPENKNKMFFDVEGLPEENYYYLIGLKVCDGTSQSYHVFWADSVFDEERIWFEFLSVLRTKDDFSLFHYGSYDAKYINAMYKKYGGEKQIPAEQLRSSLVNVLTYCYSNVYFPTYSNGLKEIAGYLGFEWDEKDASGLQSIQWRKEWEQHRNEDKQNRLILYNQQDCDALQIVTDTVALLATNQTLPIGSEEVASTEAIKPWNPYKLGKTKFATQALDFVNKCAYSDYQRTKVYWRTDQNVKISNKRNKTKRQILQPNRVVAIARPKTCPYCDKGPVYKHSRFNRTFFNLKFGGSSVKKWVTRIDYYQYRCRGCNGLFFADEYVKNIQHKSKYERGLLVWAVYQNIAARQSYRMIATGLSELFGFTWMEHNPQAIINLKSDAAAYYTPCYDEIRDKILNGNIVHVDETTMTLGGCTGYVWVFTNLEEAFYVYRDNREADIVTEVLDGFSGVLLSDFYAGYDGFQCEQQRCLIHLIRDLNDLLFKSPFDKNLKEFVIQFGILLKSIIDTIDRYGLKRRFLRKHEKDVRIFFRNYVNVDAESDSEVLVACKARFKRNEHRLFTFLEHDGVPWNNNNAELAVKSFAMIRRVIGGSSTEVGLTNTLKLLSIYQTLKNKNISFLEFLKSGNTSIWGFLSDSTK